MLRILEGVLHSHALTAGRFETGLHHHPMRNDVEAPLPEVAGFVLRLADDDFDHRAVHPLRLTAQRLELPDEALPYVRVGSGGQAPPLLRGSGLGA